MFNFGLKSDLSKTAHHNRSSQCKRVYAEGWYVKQMKLAIAKLLQKQPKCITIWTYCTQSQSNVSNALILWTNDTTKFCRTMIQINLKKIILFSLSGHVNCLDFPLSQWRLDTYSSISSVLVHLINTYFLLAHNQIKQTSSGEGEDWTQN